MIIEAHPDQHYGCRTWSQHGEDLVIMNFFAMLGIKPHEIRYLDIGACSPEVISNTKLLYEAGASGVVVDANPAWRDAYKALRPRDQLVTIAVVPDLTKEWKYFQFDEFSGRNTFCEAEANMLTALWRAPKKVDEYKHFCTINELASVCCNGRFPHFLSLDIEGLDMEVIRSADFEKHGRPALICIETRFKDTNAMIDILMTKGFRPYIRMGENLLFAHEETYKSAFGVEVVRYRE